MEKCQFCGILKPMFSLLTKACLLYKTSKMVFWRFIFGIYGMGIPGVRRGYRDLQGVTGDYKGSQGVTRGYKRLQGVTKGDRGWQGVTKDYRNFFLTRTVPHTFSCHFCIKIKVQEISNFWQKGWTKIFGKILISLFS